MFSAHGSIVDTVAAVAPLSGDDAFFAPIIVFSVSLAYQTSMLAHIAVIY